MSPQPDSRDVTLVLLGSADSAAERNHLYSVGKDWPGPKVLVLYGASSADGEGEEELSIELASSTVIFHFPSVDNSGGKAPIPLKAMKNVGMDLVKTRYLVLLEPGMQLSPTPSKAYDGIRAALHQTKHRRGTVLLLPDGTNTIGRGSLCSVEPALPESIMAQWTGNDTDPTVVVARVDLDEDWLRAKTRQAPAMVIDILSPHGKLFIRVLEEVSKRGGTIRKK